MFQQCTAMGSSWGFFSDSEIAMTVRFTETFCSCLKLSLLILATPRPQSQYSTSPEKEALYFRHTQLVLFQQHPSATTKALGHHRAAGDTACSFGASDSAESGSGCSVAVQPNRSLCDPCSNCEIRAKVDEKTAGGCRQMGEAGPRGRQQQLA